MEVSVAVPVVLDVLATRAAFVREYLSGFYPGVRGLAACPASARELPEDMDCFLFALDALQPQGVRFLSELRQLRPGVVILGYGCKADAVSAVEALRAGADDWLWFNTESDLGVWPLQINRVRARRSFETLLRQARPAASAFEHLPDAVLATDLHGRICLANAAARRWLGCTAGQCLNQPLANLWPDLALLQSSLVRDREHTAPLVLAGRRSNFAVRLTPVADLHLLTVRDVESQVQLEQRLRFRVALEDRITRLSTQFITVAPDAIRTLMAKAIADIGALCHVQRCYVGEYTDADTLSLTAEWCSDGVRARQPLLSSESTHSEPAQNEPVQIAPNFHGVLRKNGVVHVPSLASLPVAWQPERHFMAREGVDALLQVPMKVGRKVIGFVGFDAMGSGRTWHEDEIAALRMAAVAIAHGLTRLQREDELQRAHAELSAANLQLNQQVREDALTRIPNRRHFDDMIRREHRRALREQTCFAVLLCDVDFFKAYNDHYGHLEGDQCLSAVAQTLQESFQRGGDVCARYGGEEFAVLLPGNSLQQALQAADNARAAIAALKRTHKASPLGQVTVSFGVAAFDPNFRLGVEALLNCADQALYQAKHSGKNCCKAFELPGGQLDGELGGKERLQSVS